MNLNWYLKSLMTFFFHQSLCSIFWYLGSQTSVRNIHSQYPLGFSISYDQSVGSALTVLQTSSYVKCTGFWFGKLFTFHRAYTFST